MLICSIDIYGPEAYKVGEICNPNSKYIWFTYKAVDMSEEVQGKLRHGKIKVGNKVYVGLKVNDNNQVLVIRDGVIREIKQAVGLVSIAVLLNPYITRDLSIDFFIVTVGNAAKDKLIMMHGGEDARG